MFFPAFVFAREISVSALDGELDIALEGAVISLPDGGRAVCGRDGKASVQIPDGADVLLRITYPGYETEKLLISKDGGKTSFTVLMRLGTMLENRELVIEAEKSLGGTDAQSGRGVSIGGENLARTAEIGVIEDVMSSVKLLPGVGYAGVFDPAPSIRGGEPGDLMAVYDGFYIKDPYFWGGSVSIFDPRAIDKAQLYHGVFSSRFGGATSALLEITSRKPDPYSVDFEAAISTSTANLNISFPFNGKGGFMVMGKATYYDLFFAAAKGLSTVTENEALDAINAFTTPLYIRTVSFSGWYNISNNLLLKLNGFAGADGVGFNYKNEFDASDVPKVDDKPGGINRMDFSFDYSTFRTFITSQVLFSPLPFLALKATAGAGTGDVKTDGVIFADQWIRYNEAFTEKYFGALKDYFYKQQYESYPIYLKVNMDIDGTETNFQGRFDADWNMGAGFTGAVGAQGVWRNITQKQKVDDLMVDVPVSYFADYMQLLYPGVVDIPSGGFFSGEGYISRPLSIDVESTHKTAEAGAYALVEWASPMNKIAVELGLRTDYFQFESEDFSADAPFVLNPRLNIDFNIFKDKGALDSFSITAGSGFFSSMADTSVLQKSEGSYQIKQNRSFAGLLGARLDFLDFYSFNIEGYYKYGFDRGYALTLTKVSGETSPAYFFDGKSRIAGFDLILQKKSGRFIEGWIAYSFNWARYNNPKKISQDGYSIVDNEEWRYPQFHRFHNLNLVLSIKPAPNTGISARFGFASGAPRAVAGKPKAYPVLIMPDGTIDKAYLIEKYKRQLTYSDEQRDGFSLPLDLKFSFYMFNKRGKSQGEIYIGLENCLFFVQSRQKNESFDAYTGEVVEGSETASYQIPIVIPSFGLTLSY